MSTFFFDVDGTLVSYHTQEWLPGAKDLLKGLLKGGHTVVIVTARGGHDVGEQWSVEAFETMLEEAGLWKGKHLRVLYDIPWDRHLTDDVKCFAHNRVRDESWLEHNPLYMYHGLT